MSLEQQLCESIADEASPDLKKIASLLKQGADPNKYVSWFYGTAMHCAFNFAHDVWVEVVTMLLDNGGDPFVEYPHERYTPVMILVGEDNENNRDVCDREDVLELIYKKYCTTRDLKFRLLKDVCRTGEGLGSIGKYDYMDTMEEIIKELIKENYLTSEKYNELFRHACTNGYSFTRALRLMQYAHTYYNEIIKLEPLDKETLDNIKQLATEREGENDNTALEFIKEYEKRCVTKNPDREMSAIEKYKHLKAQKDAERAVRREEVKVAKSSFLNEIENQKEVVTANCLDYLKKNYPQLNRSYLVKHFGNFKNELIININYDYDENDIECSDDNLYKILKVLLEQLKSECDDKITYTVTFIPSTKDEFAFSEINIKLV